MTDREYRLACIRMAHDMAPRHPNVDILQMAQRIFEWTTIRVSGTGEIDAGSAAASADTPEQTVRRSRAVSGDGTVRRRGRPRKTG